MQRSARCWIAAGVVVLIGGVGFYWGRYLYFGGGGGSARSYLTAAYLTLIVLGCCVVFERRKRAIVTLPAYVIACFVALALMYALGQVWYLSPPTLREWTEWYGLALRGGL
jgi:hypothetical protein